MKKAIISFLFALSVAVSFGQAGTTQTIVITNSTGTITPYSPNTIPNSIHLTTSGAVNLGNNISLSYSSMPPLGTRWIVYITGQYALGIYTFNVFGSSLTQDDLGGAGNPSYLALVFTVMKDENGNLGAYRQKYYGNTVELATLLRTGNLPLSTLDGPIPQSILDTTGRGRIWYGNSTNQTSTLFAGGNGKILIGDGTDVNSVAVSGDIAITSAGVTSIAAGSIVNADVNASAAIALSKLAALTASKPVVTDGSGVLTTANQVSASYGGTGQDFSASTGFQKWSAGTASVSAITDVRDLHVSFASNSQGTYYITFPVAATVTNIEARVETALAGTDDATLEIQDNSGTDMTGNNLTAGLLTLAASATTGTGYTSTLLSNNTFSAGQRMRIISAKTTAGGTINVQVTYTRNE